MRGGGWFLIDYHKRGIREKSDLVFFWIFIIAHCKGWYSASCFFHIGVGFDELWILEKILFYLYLFIYLFFFLLFGENEGFVHETQMPYTSRKKKKGESGIVCLGLWKSRRALIFTACVVEG